MFGWTRVCASRCEVVDDFFRRLREAFESSPPLRRLVDFIKTALQESLPLETLPVEQVRPLNSKTEFLLLELVI